MTETVTLVNGASMPRIGLGTWPMEDAEAERVVADAIAGGYRLLDTAENYGNERGVGAGVRASGIDRAEVFITSKFNRKWHSIHGVREAFERSADRLGVEYIDLFLIHWPIPQQDRYVDAWRGLIQLLDAGLVRAIGTSNFLPDHVRRVVDETGITPDVNQFRVTPRSAQRQVWAADAELGIVTQAWSPLGRGSDLLSEPQIVQIADRNGCTPAQAVLSWHLSNGLSVVPKSSDPLRLRQNLAAGGVTLPAADLAILDAMDDTEIPENDPAVFEH